MLRVREAELQDPGAQGAVGVEFLPGPGEGRVVSTVRAETSSVDHTSAK